MRNYLKGIFFISHLIFAFSCDNLIINNTFYMPIIITKIIHYRCKLSQRNCAKGKIKHKLILKIIIRRTSLLPTCIYFLYCEGNDIDIFLRTTILRVPWSCVGFSLFIFFKIQYQITCWY